MDHVEPLYCDPLPLPIPNFATLVVFNQLLKTDG